MPKIIGNGGCVSKSRMVGMIPIVRMIGMIVVMERRMAMIIRMVIMAFNHAAGENEQARGGDQ